MRSVPGYSTIPSLPDRRVPYLLHHGPRDRSFSCCYHLSPSFAEFVHGKEIGFFLVTGLAHICFCNSNSGRDYEFEKSQGLLSLSLEALKVTVRNMMIGNS